MTKKTKQLHKLENLNIFSPNINLLAGKKTFKKISAKYKVFNFPTAYPNFTKIRDKKVVPALLG